MSAPSSDGRGFAEVNLADIRVEGRVRQPREARVAIVAASIEQHGCKKAIVVAPAAKKKDGTTFVLVAGLVRLQAMRRLGVKGCSAIIQRQGGDAKRRRQEIDDNLLEDDGLTVLERGRYFAAAKALYEEEHPEAAHGKASPSKVVNLATFPAEAFSSWAAERYGRADRSVRRLCQIGASVDAEAGELIANSDAADRQSELLALARLGPDQQREVAQLLTASENPADTVAEALARLDGRVDQPDLFTALYSRIIGTWERLDQRQKKQVLGQFIASVPREWIDEALSAPEQRAA